MAKKNGCKCKAPGCDNPADGFRGLCRSCYHSACRLVRLGRRTWKQFEKAGFCNPRQPKGRKPRGPVERALAKMGK
jgi:hypothetical protein